MTTPGSRRSCPGCAAAQHLNMNRFHQPCLLPWRTPHCHQTRLSVGQDCRPRTKWRPVILAGSPFLPPCATHWRYCHPDLTEPRQDVNSSFPPCMCHPRGERVFAHTQVRDPRESAAACFGHALGRPISLAIDHLGFTSFFCQVPRWNLFKFLPFFIHCCFCCVNLHGLRHKNNFVYQILMLQWIVPLSCNMTLMIIW